MFPLSKFQPPDAPFCSVESILHERTRHAALFIIECTYTYTCSIQRRGGHATSHRTQKICSPIQPRSRCRRQTLFAPQYIPMEGRRTERGTRRRQLPPSFVHVLWRAARRGRRVASHASQRATRRSGAEGLLLGGREGGSEDGWEQ